MFGQMFAYSAFSDSHFSSPGLDRVDRALRLAHPAINAFVRVDDEHVSTGHTSTQSMVLQRMQLSLTT
jgi:hypothetical protein